MESKSSNQTAIQEGSSVMNDDVPADSSNDIDERQQEPRFGFLSYGSTAFQVIIIVTWLEKPTKIVYIFTISLPTLPNLIAVV
jgi:hypothetical protein